MSRLVTILILKSNSLFSHYVKSLMIAVLHLLVFLIDEGFLFHSPGFFAFPTLFLPSSFLFSLIDTFYIQEVKPERKKERQLTSELIKLRNCSVPGQNKLKSPLISVM